MSDEQFRQYVQELHQQMAVLLDYVMQLSSPQQQQVLEVLENMSAAIANLQLLQEEMRTSLEALDIVEDQLLQQNQQFYAERKHYYDFFQFCPDAYLVTDATGLILEANSAIASLLKIPQSYLPGKPLAVFVSYPERSVFRCQLAELHQYDSVQRWEVCLQPRAGELFDAVLRVAPVRNQDGSLVALRICMHQVAIASTTSSSRSLVATAVNVPLALDGLQVLLVDDEADARELITALLQQQGIVVTAVATVAEAMQELERSRPDVLISDIRMPDEDGYALIQKIRALEAEKGWQIPAAALTAYLAEDRAAVMAAGFESHLHKLAQPTELIAMVAQLAGRG